MRYCARVCTYIFILCIRHEDESAETCTRQLRPFLSALLDEDDNDVVIRLYATRMCIRITAIIHYYYIVHIAHNITYGPRYAVHWTRFTPFFFFSLSRQSNIIIFLCTAYCVRIIYYKGMMLCR